MFEVLFPDMIFEYSFDSSVSVWYFGIECFFMARMSEHIIYYTVSLTP